MMSWYWGMGPWGMYIMIAAWVGLFAGTAWLIARVTRTEHNSAPVESPRTLLDRRFASGEITPEQYAQMRHALSTDSSASA